jgi:hypothetical protein
MKSLFQLALALNKCSKQLPQHLVLLHITGVENQANKITFLEAFSLKQIGSLWQSEQIFQFAEEDTSAFPSLCCSVKKPAYYE